MRINHFLNCLNYNGVSTGSSGAVIAAYDLASGSGVNGNLDLIYNLLKSTGSHFSGNSIYGPNIPIINVGTGKISGYQFSGLNTCRIGYTTSGDFSLLMDIDYNGCARNTSNIAQVLFSTSDAVTGLNGTFYIGINDVNRLYFETSGYLKTLSYELRPSNMVYVGFGDRKNIEFGIFDFQSQSFLSESITLPGSQNASNKLYVGGFLTNTNQNYTGYSGKIYNILLANKMLEFSGIKSCSNCLFSTGTVSGAPSVTSVNVPYITGYNFSGFTEYVVTGYSSSTGQVIKSDSSIVNLVFPSGLIGPKQTSEVASVMTGSYSVQITGITPLTFPYDTGRIYSYTKYDMEFHQSLVSGDTLEIYTFPSFNPSINIPIKNLQYPNINGMVQVVGNGLVETNGTDYTVIRGIISGFEEDDVLIYDVLTGSSLVSPFSGWWSRDKVLMSGGAYYPTSAQFNETIDTERIIFSGITGARFSINSDLYINGQKLVSGFHYNLIDDSVSGWCGGITGLTIAVLNPNVLPALVVNALYSPTGGPPTGIESVEGSELSILPNFGSYTKYYSDISGSFNVYSGLTGFNEQVWVNGIRQRLSIDYVRNYSCSTFSGIVDEPYTPFNFFNNETGYFNIN